MVGPSLSACLPASRSSGDWGVGPAEEERPREGPLRWLPGRLPGGDYAVAAETLGPKREEAGDGQRCDGSLGIQGRPAKTVPPSPSPSPLSPVTLCFV